MISRPFLKIDRSKFKLGHQNKWMEIGRIGTYSTIFLDPFIPLESIIIPCTAKHIVDPAGYCLF
jgi:hypothetical protein